MMRRRQFLGFAAAAAGCGRREPGVKVRLAVSVRQAMAPTFLAYERGYFAEEGLDAELIYFNRGPEVIPLLAGGEVDVGFYSLNASTINAVGRGAVVRIVAGRETASPGCSTAATFYGLRDKFPAGLNDLRLLKGGRVAVSTRTGSGEFRFDMMLRRSGMRREDVEIVEVPREEAVGLLMSGRVEAMMAHDADKRLDEASSRLVAGVGFADMFPGFQYSHVFFGRALLEGDPEPGAAVLSAYLRAAWAYLDGTTPKILAEIAAANNLDLDALEQNCRGTFEPNGEIHPEDIQAFVDWARERGYTEHQAEVSKLYETRFLEAAWKRVGRRA